MSMPQAPDPAVRDTLCDDEAQLSAAVAAMCARHGLGGQAVQRYDSGSLPVYAIGSGHVLKLFPTTEAAHAETEARVLTRLDGALPIPTPRLLADDTLDGWRGLLMTQLQGERLVDVWPRLSLADRDRHAEGLGHAVAALHALDVAALADLEPRWAAFVPAQRASAVERQRARQLDPFWLEQIEAFLERWMPPMGERRVLLHTELMREHLMAAPGPRGGWNLSGLFDFEPAMIGDAEYDFASFGLFVACGDGRFLRRSLLAYGLRPDQLDAALQNRLMACALLHRYSRLRWYLERLPAGAAVTLEQLAARWWPFSPGNLNTPA